MSRDWRILLWDLNTGAIKRAIEGHEKDVLSVVYNEGRIYTSGDTRKSVKDVAQMFANAAVVGTDPRIRVDDVIERLEQLHTQAGRERQSDPFSPRTLDLDVLLYGDLIRQKLKLPRADIEKYGFVLGPLAEVAPRLRHPVSGKTMGEIWDGFDQERHPIQKVDIDIS